jgi:hypothetical protein
MGAFTDTPLAPGHILGVNFLIFLDFLFPTTEFGWAKEF